MLKKMNRSKILKLFQIKSNVHLPRNDTSLTFNEQISYIDIERNVNEEESDDNDDNCASYGPRLSISMTRF